MNTRLGNNGDDKSNNEIETVSKYSERPIWTRFKKFPFMTLEDNLYSNFITKFLGILEPRRFQSQQMIYQELDTPGEFYFIMEGKYDVGYNMNRQKQYRL